MTTLKPSSPPTSPGSSKAPNILLGKTDRLFVVGKTESGKTFATKQLLKLKVRRKKIAIIADFKWTGDGEDGRPIPFADSGDGTVDVPRHVKRFNPKFRVQLFEPSVPGWADENLQAFFRDCMKHASKHQDEGGLVVYIDEAFRVCDIHHNPQAFSDLWTNGRKYGLEAWAGSQFPSKLPDELMSQAENWLIFRIINPKHLAKVAEFVGTGKIKDVRLPLRYFWFWSQKQDDATLMAPFKVAKKGGSHVGTKPVR